MYRIFAVIQRVALAVGIAVSVYSCNSSDKMSDSGLPVCAVTADLDSLFQRIFPDADGSGGIAIVMHRDTIIYRHAFGVADLQTMVPVTDSTLFNLSSASKIFTSAALLKLCERGMISLDDSLSRFFPEFECDVFDKITIRHILTHSSGLPDLRPRNQAEWNKYKSAHGSVFALGEDYARYGTGTEFMHSFQNMKTAEFVPGTHCDSQDAAYILVAPLIERVTRVDFDDWMSENIFRPAGMREAFYYTYDGGLPATAHAYRPARRDTSPLVFRSDDGKWEEYDLGEVPYFLTRADRGVYGSARDFMQWNKALYSGKIISDSSLAAMNTPYVATEIPMVSFGLGGAVRREPGFPDKSYHMNTNGGYAIVEGSWPQEKLHYIVFANRADWNQRDVTYEIDSIFRAKNFLR